MKGYLYYTTHDGDEIDATFIPETETVLINLLKSVEDDLDMERFHEIFNEWAERNPDSITWHTQTQCSENWPFNGLEILGTFYHLVY